MSTLKESLEKRCKDELPQHRSADSADAPARTLQVYSWNREKWVFPWSHFSAAHHQGAGETEHLVLSFSHHQVVLEGSRLALLLPEIASFRLDCLRDMPAKFRPQADKNEPFISRVSVRSASDLPESRPQAS